MLIKYSKGVTLVELMLAMLIGIVIIGGVMSLYVGSRNTQRIAEDHVQLSSDARFAMETISYDLKHSGVYGQNNVPGTLVCGPFIPCPTALPLAVDDCENNWYLSLDEPMVASDDSASFNGIDYSGSCASKGYIAGTDMLGVHYADPTKIVDALLANNIAYVRSNTLGGGIFIGSAIPDYEELTKYWESEYSWEPALNPLGETSNHKLVGHFYYVSDYTDVPGDNIPSLRRVELQEGPAMVDEVLLSGVENMQLQFGITTSPTPGKARFADTYVSASNIPLRDGVRDWSRVRSVKLWLLLRSERKPRSDMPLTQKFTIAGKPEQTFTDGFHRQLVTGIVYLRNTVRNDELSVSGG